MKNNERKDWCKLPYAIILDERLTPTDALVYAVLLDVSENGEVKRSIAAISQLTGLSPRCIRYVLEHLYKAGYIVSKKTDGRKLILEIKPVIEEKAQEKPKPTKKQEEEPEHIEEALMSILAKKIKVKNLKYVQDVYDDLKAQATARANDKTKVLAYLSKMISSYEDKSDGFDPYAYEFLINNFDD